MHLLYFRWWICWKKNAKFYFADTEKRAFEQLREVLSKKPSLRTYNAETETELHTDASAQGYAAILLQQDDEVRSLHLVYHASGKTAAEISEQKYHSYELESNY